MPYKDRETGLAYQKSYQPAWFQRHKTEHRTAGRERRRWYRRTALEILGNRCIRCGFDDVRALQIDHVNGRGYGDPLASNTGTSAQTVYRKIALTGNTDGLQLLCANCNWIKRAENNEDGANGKGVREKEK